MTSNRFLSMCQQHIAQEVRFIYLFSLLLCCLALVFIAFNALVLQYAGNFYLPKGWILLAPFIIVTTFLAQVCKKHIPNVALFTYAYGTYFVILFVFFLLATGIQYTPFPTIDHFLLALDQKLGVDLPAVMAWTAQRPSLHAALVQLYELLGKEMILIPLLLPLFKRQQLLDHFFITLLISYSIGILIYYFFPTAAPSSIIDSVHFLQESRATALKFYQIHHDLPVTTYKGGMIAFPSFHVCWALLYLYPLRSKRCLFYPLLLINGVMIISTVMLGWHYLVDVISGVLLAVVAIYLTNTIYRFVFVAPHSKY